MFAVNLKLYLDKIAQLRTATRGNFGTDYFTKSSKILPVKEVSFKTDSPKNKSIIFWALFAIIMSPQISLSQIVTDQPKQISQSQMACKTIELQLEHIDKLKSDVLHLQQQLAKYQQRVGAGKALLYGTGVGAAFIGAHLALLASMESRFIRYLPGGLVYFIGLFSPGAFVLTPVAGVSGAGLLYFNLNKLGELQSATDKALASLRDMEFSYINLKTKNPQCR